MQQSPATGSANAQTVSLVDEQHGPMRAADLVQPAQRRQRAVGAEHRVGDDQRTLLVAGRQRGLHGVDVVVRGDDHPGPRQPAGVDQRGVREGVGDQQRPRTGQRDHRAEVGGVPRGEHQAGLGADEPGQGGFELLVQLGGAGDQPRASGARPPGAKRGDPAVDHGRMLGQAEVVVGGQVEFGGHRGTRTQRAAQAGLPALLLDGVEPGQR